jgi:hypothetical protein
MVDMMVVPVFRALVIATRPGATANDLRSDKLLEEVPQALRAEGCCAEVEIVGRCHRRIAPAA